MTFSTRTERDQRNQEIRLACILHFMNYLHFMRHRHRLLAFGLDIWLFGLLFTHTSIDDATFLWRAMH
jgi:hypothetical protein